MYKSNNIKLQPAVPALLPKSTCIKSPNIPANSYINNDFYQESAYYNQLPINEPMYYEPYYNEYNPYTPSMQYIDYPNMNQNFLESLKFQMMTGCRRYQKY